MTPDSRNLYRSHERRCPHRDRRRDHKKCRCPIWLDFSYAGKRTCKSLRTRNWQVAEDLIRKWEVECEISDEIPAVEPKTIEAACREFLAEAKTRGLRAATIYKYELLLRRLQTFSRDRGLRLIRDVDVEKLRHFRTSWPHRNTAARKRLEELRAFFRFCHESGWIADNPAKKLQAPISSDPPREPFSDEQVEKIRLACDIYPGGKAQAARASAQRLRALVELLLHTGLRIGDAVMLRKDCIVDGKLRIRTEKTGTEVFCPLPPSVLNELHMVRCTSTEYFFWTGASKLKSAVGDWQRALKRLFNLAGIPNAFPHRFRHTFAKRLLMARVPPERVAVLMGHRNASITMRHYSTWVKDRQEQLEADVRRVWAEQYPSNTPNTRSKPQESAMRPLCEPDPVSTN